MIYRLLHPQSCFGPAAECDGGLATVEVKYIVCCNGLICVPLSNRDAVGDLDPTYQVVSDLLDIGCQALLFVLRAEDDVVVVGISKFFSGNVPDTTTVAS